MTDKNDYSELPNRHIDMKFATLVTFDDVVQSLKAEEIKGCLYPLKCTH